MNLLADMRCGLGDLLRRPGEHGDVGACSFRQVRQVARAYADRIKRLGGRADTSMNLLGRAADLSDQFAEIRLQQVQGFADPIRQVCRWDFRCCGCDRWRRTVFGWNQ
jgi:hypothetical protein